LTIIDSSTDAAKGPVTHSIAPSAHQKISLHGYSVAFLQLLHARPQFHADRVVNAASFAGGGVSPGEIVAIFGADLGPAAPASEQISSPGVVDNLLSGARVWFDGIAAPIAYASAEQLIAVVPYEVAGQANTQIQVEYLGVMSAPVTVPVVASAPGLFTDGQTGSGQASAWNQDGTQNSASNPAPAGTIILLMATGEGETLPEADGKIAGATLPKPKLSVSAQVGGMPAKVTSAAGVSGMAAGSLAIKLQIPANVTRGTAVPVTVTIGTASSQAGVTIAVQ